MPSKTDSSVKDSAIKSNRPEGLVKLLFVREPPLQFDYYVRYPIRSGPQPLLGVRTEDKGFRFPDGCGFTPRKLERELHKSSRMQIAIPLPHLTFSDSLTVLPTSFPHRKTASGKPDIVADPELLVAMSILTTEYSAMEKQYRADKEFMASIPKSAADVRFRPEGGKRFTDKLAQLLPRTEEESRMSLMPDLHEHLIRLLRWVPWNLALGHACAQKGGEDWQILERWRRWEMLEMSFPERAYDLAKNPASTPAHPDEFRHLGDALRQRCRRRGLSV